MRKFLGNMVNFLACLWRNVLFVVVIALLLLKWGPVPFGYDVLVCKSNSMAPEFHVGSLVYIDKNYDTDSVEVGDIIAFTLNDGSKVTHRVNAITEEGIITKGDANEDVDISPISKEQIFGENVLQLEYIGNVYKDFPNMLVISVGGSAFAFLLLLDLLAKWLLGEDEKDEEKEKVALVDTCSDTSAE